MRPKFNFPAIDSSSDSDSSSSSSSSHKRAESPPPPSKKKYKIPKIKSSQKPKKNIQALRDDLPNLSHHSDEVLQSLPWSALFRLNSSLETNHKSGKKLSVNMQKNLEKIKKKPVKVEAGEDNRSNKLHESRYIGGHICQNSEI